MPLSELYMWLGAIFCIAVMTATELSKGAPPSSGPSWATFLSQVTATLIGGCLAGLVGFSLARKARRDGEKDAAVRFIVKLKLITDDFHSVMKSIDDSLVTANEHRQTHLRMWERVRPILGLGEPRFIEADEAAPFLRHGKADLANRVMLLSVRHATFLKIVGEYGHLRDELANFVPATSMDGPRAIAEVPEDKRVVYTLKSDALEALIREFLSNARRDLAEAKVLCEQVGPAAKRMLRDDGMPTLMEPDRREEPGPGT